MFCTNSPYCILDQPSSVQRFVVQVGRRIAHAINASGVEWSGVEWSGVEWSGVEWSGVEWSGEYSAGQGRGGEGREARMETEIGFLCASTRDHLS